jgi:ethanolamine ammonia-lyase large subunit
MTLASEFKEGDALVGGTNDARAREEARRALLATPIAEFDPARFVDDAVSELLARATDRDRHAATKHLTVGEVKRTLLGPHGADWASRHAAGLPSEAIAALAKAMTDDDLSTVAGTLFNPLPGPGVRIGAAGHFGSRIQPNSPADEETAILLSVLEGLSYGCGDVIVGINPAADDLDTIVQLERLLERIVTRLELPTRFCVLSDIVKQTTARAHTRIDVGFQSLAGTSRALRNMVGLDADGVLDLANGFSGLYFETGQGSEVTNSVAMGVDMVTLEARTYGLARAIQRTTGAWTIVNDVAGFIGPEVFKSPAQLLRTCLEDAVMAKLHGLTMGLDVCATFHMGIDPATLEALTDQIVARAAPAYLMAVAGNADPMLGYLTTSFRQHPRLRRATARRIATPMADRLRELGVGGDSVSPDAVGSLYATYHRAGGDRRTAHALRSEARRRLDELADRGWDLGRGHLSARTARSLCPSRARGARGHLTPIRERSYRVLEPGRLPEPTPLR